ncbi:MAG: recombinase family protein [Defluviitaleaceae bacterium]|nr:recombinase family protein [Defluviitaleaceae bacterium]MCL2275138.1 recombinase family protein [Defluviitaleaceae bacterium]
MFTVNASQKHTIAVYLRISEHDDALIESNSITNQRALVNDFISRQSEFSNAETLEYIDDGISGSHTERASYKRLMADIGRGLVQCIIVKDLSRIGRDLIDVDDLLMNYLVVREVRFIAINNGYDSVKSPLSNLELAVINLANQHYNRDLAQKSMSSKIVKMKKGEFISPWAIFGYKKSETERNKLVIDGESAEYVRLIFSLATDGNNTVQIAKILNARGIPTPSEYKRRNGIMNVWKPIDPSHSFWLDGSVGNILRDIRYTGVSVNNKSKAVRPGTSRCVQRPADEWIIVCDAHEAIVSKAEYDRAHEALRREMMNHVSVDHIFHGKIKCPVCHRTLRRIKQANPAFVCMTHKYTDHYNCPDHVITQADIEKVVLASVKALVAMLIDQDEMNARAIEQAGVTKVELEGRIKVGRRALQTLEGSVTKNITDLVAGIITQEEFLSRKETVNNAIEKKTSELNNLQKQLLSLAEGKDVINQRLEKFRPLLTVENLDRELVDLLVDKVVVHGEKEIEIVWMERWYA